MSLSFSSVWSPIPGGVSAPAGFKASGIKAGLKSSGKLDLALLLAPEEAICAGRFTTSSARAACINLCLDRLKATEGKARAVLINSGQANACTGDYGLLDSIDVTEQLARHLELSNEEVLMCSTGVIGVRIPISKLLLAIKPLVQALSDDGGMDAANAILTTDLVHKQLAVEAELDGRRVRIGGMAKGSGMIHPNMSTMLAYMTCDAGVPLDIWQAMIGRVVEKSFNAITVDGDTSTNDSFIAFSAGDSLSKKHLEVLEDGLTAMAQHLAKAIARDGEGANCLLEVLVEGASNVLEARLIARTICGSSLVKTAIHGCDPNWGRIIAALGCASPLINLKEVDLWVGEFQLIKHGEPLCFDHLTVSEYMKSRMKGKYLESDSINIRLLVGSGSGTAVAWGCDLSDQYIRINADYTT